MMAVVVTRRVHRLSALFILLVVVNITLFFRYYPNLPRESVGVGEANDGSIVVKTKNRPAKSDDWRYSVKPIVYIFPQYYPFPENDRLWGVNFTEWDNVRKVTHNVHGLETIRPHESIGYYNGVEFKTRQRQGRFLRDNGFHGAVYHHYWFAGKPVMDGVIQAMLKDGEPNTPFMLSWANEPWTKNWDGSDSSEVLIAQDYGLIADWKEHFDWLLPFFRHPQYIRSEGRIQFLVYNPSHMKHLGPYMFAAWRQWALDAGLGGMDIIETRWHSEKWNQAVPDAINEFQPHSGGLDHQRHPYSKRLSRVYHRGTLACWDSSPRHSKGGGGMAQGHCHPKTWQYFVVEMLRKIKSDPNPPGSENFFFINALNEWGEGNVLEPSVQFGDGYGKAMKNAMEISEKLHSWPDSTLDNYLTHKSELNTIAEQPANICVLVHAFPWQAADRIFKLEAMLRTLQAQKEKKWRAIVFQPEKAGFGGEMSFDEILFRTFDRRIQHISIPDEIKSLYSTEDAGFGAVDWVIANLNKEAPSCASAKYLLIASGANTYEPDAFDSAAKGEGLLKALNFESRRTVWKQTVLEGQSWNDRCGWVDDPAVRLCSPSRPTLEGAELGATFIDLGRFVQEGHTFRKYTSQHPENQGAAMLENLANERGWNWVEPTSENCHVMQNPTYTSCRTSGNIWVDSPRLNETGCYSPSAVEDAFQGLGDFDLNHYRKHGHCMKFNEEGYRKHNEA